MSLRSHQVDIRSKTQLIHLQVLVLKQVSSVTLSLLITLVFVSLTEITTNAHEKPKSEV